MKSSVPIPSDVWEEKKALIAALYKDEEWPLKQVIKKIRSDNFNPSETQLRSRLKKWRVTKPSRQTRKKSHEPPPTRDNNALRETSSPKGHSNCSSPKPQTRVRPVPTTAKGPATEPEWYMTNRHYESHGLPTTIPLDGHDIPTSVWAPTSSQPSPLSSPSNSRVNSHGSLAILTSTSPYDQSQTSPLVDGALLNPTPAMTPTYTDASYSFASEPCMQKTPVSTAAGPPTIQWAMPQWYTMTANTVRDPMPFYTTGPLTPPIDPMMQVVPPQFPQHLSEFHEDMKSWKRTMSVPYGPGMAAHINHNLRQQQPKPLERKVSLPSKITTGQPPSGMVTPTSPYFPHGQHPTLCSPNYTYPGPESLVHRSSIEF
ncbi:hypothetical protein BJY01DRAFT_229720 [Aspergillus pseudoustus]|uniref:Clr5 domain-containing protein n=1 Tax=Aspergillus pseudoustus TaxID=1810923 RepID=A0ABR4IFI9_9EURO